MSAVAARPMWDRRMVRQPDHMLNGTGTITAERAPARRTRWLLAVGLMVLAPFCAEYVIGYDTSTGDPLALLGGLLIFAPLYRARPY